MKNTIVTITGPTCSGKSTLARFLSQRGNIPEVRSFTTRPKRRGEVDEEHYDFLTKEQVQAIPQNELIEIVSFNGNYYGNTHAQMKEALAEGEGVATVVVEPGGVWHWQKAAKQFGFNHFALYLEQRPETLIKRFAERLKSVHPDNVASEINRLENMVSVEQPTWGKAFKYDLTVRDLGASLAYTEVTAEMLLGFLTLSFSRASSV